MVVRFGARKGVWNAKRAAKAREKRERGYSRGWGFGRKGGWADAIRPYQDAGDLGAGLQGLPGNTVEHWQLTPAVQIHVCLFLLSKL